MRWLHYLGVQDVIRVNYDDPHQAYPIDISEDSFCFMLGDRRIDLEEIDAVWYRKGKNWFCDQFFPVAVEGRERFTRYLNSKLEQEATKLSEYLHFLIGRRAHVLGSATRSDLNKLLVLDAAREAGLLVPHFHVANYREGIRAYFGHSPDLITKSISNGLYLFESEESHTGYFSYTEKLSGEDIAALADTISPSFLQQNIHKKYELRVFYLEGRCHAMAIFSQTEEKTRVDFRKYNDARPNRFVPFRLPGETEQKIRTLFSRVGLNTGSVDLLVDEQDQYYFLEINPVGQFNMVSHPCNCFLEKEIAQYLITHAQERRTHRAAGNAAFPAAVGA